MLPSELGPFFIDALLGEGGSAIVYAARLKTSPDEPLALKVLHPDLGLSPSEVERFLGEAEKLGRLRHPAVVSLHSSGLLPDGRPFIAMPRLDGTSLAARISAGGLSPDVALPLFAQVARGVAALHAAGLIHRDIKPENVFWLARENRLVLLDLGIARDADGEPSTTTRAGFSRGTPQYMAPERLFGSRASVRTDVYELALLFYVMLAGRPPWVEGDAQARLEPKIPPEMAAKLPSALVRMLDDALALQVERRPEGIEALLRTIDEACSATPDASLAPTERMAVLAPTRRSPLIASPPPGMVEHATPEALVTTPATSLPPSRTSRSGTSLAIAATILGASILGAAALVVTRASPTGLASASAREGAEPAAPSSRVSPEPTATAEDPGTPSAMPSGSSSASPLAPAPSTSVAPKSSGPATPSASATSAPQSGVSPSCVALVALVCTPTSGATPEECTAWKRASDDWQKKLPPAIAEQTCAQTLSTEKAGLDLRKKHPLP